MPTIISFAFPLSACRSWIAWKFESCNQTSEFHLRYVSPSSPPMRGPFSVHALTQRFYKIEVSLQHSFWILWTLCPYPHEVAIHKGINVWVIVGYFVFIVVDYIVSCLYCKHIHAIVALKKTSHWTSKRTKIYHIFHFLCNKEEKQIEVNRWFRDRAEH